MKVKVIGCGNAFSERNFNQSFLLEENGRKMLIDCGYQAQAALNHAGIKVTEIDDIYISHLHADHIGCLEWVAFQRYDWVTFPRPEKAADFKNGKAPNLYCEKNLMKKLWTHSLRGGLESMEGFIAKLDTFFHPMPLNPDKGFVWQGWHCGLIQQIHIVSGNTVSYAFGLFMTKPGHKNIYFTTDSQHCSPLQVKTFYQKADVIFQDCEISPFLSSVHANYIELAGYDEANNQKLPADVKKKMLLSHYQDYYNDKKKQVVIKSNYNFYKAPADAKSFVSLIDFDWDECAQKDGFLGFVKLGAEYEF